MLNPKPPRDWMSTLAGLAAVLGLAVALGTVFAAPAVRLITRARQEVWVTIIPPAAPGAPAASGAPAAHAAPAPAAPAARSRP